MKNTTKATLVIATALILIGITSVLAINLNTETVTKNTKTYTYSVYYPWEKGQQYTIALYLDSELEAFEHGQYIHVKQIDIDGGGHVQTFKFTQLDLDIDSYMLEIYKGNDLIVMNRGIFD